MHQALRLGNAARRRRVSLGLTKAEASRRAGIALGTLRSIERGDWRRRTRYVLEKLATTLGVKDLRELAAAELLEQEPLGSGPSTLPPPCDEDDELDVDALDPVDDEETNMNDSTVCTHCSCSVVSGHELLQFFVFEHLPQQMRSASQPFGEVARDYVRTGQLDHGKLFAHIEELPENCERNAARVRVRGASAYAELGVSDLALRGLLEAKDCAVRAVVWRPPV